MRILQAVKFMLLYLPLSAFAHPGHPDWIKTSDSGHVEIYEALLFVLVLLFFAWPRHTKKQLNMVKSRQDKTHSRRQ